ncbi:hypothetical protein ACFL4G_04065 [Thermodesulfobacteriota bacterium]
MDRKTTKLVESANFARYRPGQKEGHYESYFLRANHPEKPEAFWIRYTIFSPHGAPGSAIGELWAVYFDGATGENRAVKKEVPIASCLFDHEGFKVVIDDAILDAGKLQGSASSDGSVIGWDLEYGGYERPLFLLAPKLYGAKLPKAKALVGLPLAAFNGELTVDGRRIPIRNWIGSQNHNWGSKHTDDYAWGQVAGFDDDTGSFFEVGTARLKIGPVWTPYMTLMVLRHRGEEHALNTIGRSLRASGAFDYFQWEFASENEAVAVSGSIAASLEDFVGLNYYNPPGGIKHCLNTKIASCRLSVKYKKGKTAGSIEVLETASRAAFEILTDARDHGVKILA